MANPWMTSDDLIASVKRKIALPISQNTFSEADILAFANEEMMISQVPSILEYHEEYFVSTLTVPLLADTSSYEMPNRAIGMRLRNVFWQDENGNLMEMVRVSSSDAAFFQRNVSSNTAIFKFYIEGNNIVLLPSVQGSPTGSIVFKYYLRPNQLVDTDRAATITSFSKTITISNVSVVSGDTVTIDETVFTAGTDFAIGATGIITANNLANAITTNGVATASNGSPSTAVCTVSYSDVSFEFSTSRSAAFSIQTTQGIVFDSVPANLSNSSLVDFLQYNVGHKIRAFDVQIPSGGVSGMTINFTSTDVPSDLIIGDIVCSSNECIIPQIPSDLHNVLAERTCARILASLGDAQGLQMSNGKIAEMENKQNTLLDQRIDGQPQKVFNKHSLLHYGKMRSLRRL